MPWVDEELCNGCGLCVEECPVDTIVMNDDVADIEMADCIRCGICHDICPTEAIKHDRLKVPEEVRANVVKTEALMEACEEYLGDPRERQKCLVRTVRHFENMKMIAEKTLAELEKLMK
ncbi:MAG: 4Fe-4S binding protein [Deltaproteobacteria bacterium]|jgi:ferredoxin|nr:4Fe-4S binding protein [Deltaproteobacteria bacterium]MBN2844365.1 4Fe-4S binding protein [Deltaproteobacteria bacterium]